MRFQTIRVQSDLTIVGAGMPGIITAIEASRKGLSVALINNRGFLGGNASPEIRIDICGADGSSEFNYYARETGIMEELRLENLHRNPQGNAYLWHTVLVDYVAREKNIRTFMNTNVDEVETDEAGNILWVAGSQSGTEKRYEFNSPLFLDDTGDGTVGYLAGADYRIGRESREEFNESIAPETPDEKVLLSTLSFYTKDTGRNAPFTLPEFAQDNGVEDTLAYREIPDRKPGNSRYEGYRMQWFYETGHGLDQIGDAEEVIHEHRRMIYGIWDHIKNSGNYDASQYDFEYISSLPGKRESRRLLGDHILTERDIADQVDFDDAIAYGGWSIDLHALEGFFDKDLINRHYILNGVYQIPLRSCYSRNVNNLMVASRCMSTTHVAFGTTRVMATLSMVGQAMANVARLCKDYRILPREVGTNHLEKLQDMLVDSGLYIINKQKRQTHNLLKDAQISVSSVQSLAFDKQTGAYNLDKDTALIIPTEKSIDKVELLLKANANTELSYRILTSAKDENYKPQTVLNQGTVTLRASEDFSWLSIPLEGTTATGKIMVELGRNEGVDLATADDRVNGIFLIAKRQLIGESTYTNLESKELLSELWQRQKAFLCFKAHTAEEIYSGQNLVNGLSRNHGRPNLWLSAPDNGSEELIFKLPEAREIHSLELTFDSDLDYYYDNLEIYHDFNTMPTLVKDYKILAKTAMGYEVIAEVTDNYQRVNRLAITPVTTAELKVVLESTNGDRRYGIYEIKAL